MSNSTTTAPVEALRDPMNTDDAPVQDVIAAMLICARSWRPEARIIGNVRAGDIVRALTASPATDDIGRLVERLRVWADDYVETSEIAKLVHESATVLLSQQSEINRLRNEADREREECAKVADRRRDTHRSEADGFAEDNQARFVRNIRAGEAHKCADAIRARAALPKAST